MSKYIKIVTLGCPKNVVDSRQMMGYLEQSGYKLTDDPAQAQVILVNTCGFIEAAKRESIETILQWAAWKKRGKSRFLIVAGCLVQKYVDELASALPEVDLFLGTGDIAKLPGLLNSLQTGMTHKEVGNPDTFLFDDSIPGSGGLDHPKSYAYVKIAEGCDNCCTYCVIPSLRGRYRSRTVESIVKEATRLTEAGVKELVLVAQDTTLYGTDLYGEYRLPYLLKELALLPGVKWIRLLYAYPNHITRELLETIREEKKVCSYLDIPLQHISDRILKNMGRSINQEETRRVLREIRETVPGITLRSTFIVGFPGERKEDFELLISFLQEAAFERAGFFAYSQEPGTKAAGFSHQISPQEKALRLERASQVQEIILAQKLAEKIGQALPILVDGASNEYEGLWEGRTEGDAPEIDGIVYFKPYYGLKPGDLIAIRVTHSQEFALMGEIADEFGQ